MSRSATASIRFEAPGGVALAATFDAGRLTSDGGLPWLAATEAPLGLCTAFAAQSPKWRRGPVRLR
jgi:hypothetical protein